MGPFTIEELYYKHAPRTCRNFIELSQRGYYDNVKFHHIIEDFVVQGGDPTGTGRGGESIYGSKFEDEIKPKLKHTGAGLQHLANAYIGMGIHPVASNKRLSQECPREISIRCLHWLDNKYFEKLYHYNETDKAWRLYDPNNESVFKALRNSTVNWPSCQTLTHDYNQSYGI
ncbi:hypothetical protein IFM89_037929 [Coptis chinensis]|uniref:Peptidyl-prolyl cis-trans isomerase n=1 Tax=Coptis chinensis TaxID=261450 RepID=A0A835HQB2_9MAGN|nr:hypothetical protein IFM89_037929 [Coptis chinensis]